MTTLPKIQAGLVAAILRDDATGVAPAIEADGLAPEARIQVYRNHVLSSLTEMLASTYPVVCRLVHRRVFGFVADAYIRRQPPTGPCLFEYGATVPAFLASFPACADYPYLGDVARLQWAMNAVLHAKDATPIAPAGLASVPPEDVGRLTFQLDPSAVWLYSPWPVDRIWRANQPDAADDVPVDIGAGGVRLEIRRQADDLVTTRRLELAEFAFRSALGAGASLETAADTAMTEDPGFELTEALRALLGEALLVGFTTVRAKGDFR
jgi:Putative DNA-binding domain